MSSPPPTLQPATPGRAARPPSDKAALQDFAEGLFRAFLDPATRQMVVEVGRKVALHRNGSWVQIGDRPVGREAWTAFWSTFCRTAHLDPRQSGYVSTLLGDAAVVEAILPPLTWQPLFLAAKRPVARGFDALVSSGAIAAADGSILRDAIRDSVGILIVGPSRSGRTTVIEALVDAIPRTDRIALVERRAQVRATHPQVVRLRDRAANAVTAAATISPDWVVVDDAAADTIALAAAVLMPCIMAVRGGDAETVRGRAAGLMNSAQTETAVSRTLLDRMFPVTVSLTAEAGSFRCVSVVRA